MMGRGSLRTALARGSHEVAPYLMMLHLAGADGPAALGIVRGVLAQGVDEQEALALLADTNWRPNLVVAFAAAVGLSSPAVTDALWTALDRGSWVAPQLAVAALIADDRFLDRARARLLDPTRLDAKAAGALLAMATVAAPGEPWVAERAADPALTAHIASAVDDGAALARAWHRAVIEIVGGR